MDSFVDLRLLNIGCQGLNRAQVSTTRGTPQVTSNKKHMLIFQRMPAVKLERVRYYGHAKAGILTLFMEML
jgi:hypothetical protein